MRHSKRHCIKYLMGYNSLTDVPTTTTHVRTSEPLKKIPNKIPTFQRVNCKIILDTFLQMYTSTQEETED